jgi:hypothetical protein
MTAGKDRQLIQQQESKMNGSLIVMNEQQLVRVIKAHIERGDKSQEKAEQHYIAAGQHLKTLKKNHDGSWAEWEKLLKTKIGIGKSRASELMAIADGIKTIKQTRINTAKRTAKAKTRLKLSASSGEKSKRKKKQNGNTSLLEIIECDGMAEDATPEENWQRSMANAAGDILARPALWKKLYPGWEKFEVTSDMVTLAKQATQAWRKLTNQLEKRKS